MTQHIIDTDELEKLQQYVMIDMTNGVEQCKHGDYVHIDDLRALIANSPQADGINATREELDRFLRDMRDGKPNPKAQETLSRGRAILRQMEAQADGMVLEGLIDHVCLKAAEIHNLGKFVSDTDAQNVINEIRAMLSAYKPQADETYGQDFHLAHTCTRIRRLLKLLNITDPSDGKDHVLMGMLFTLLGTICRNVEVSQETAKEASARAIADHNTIMALQADDVRKDAEREWTENDGNHESSKKLANRMGRIDVKFRSGFVAKDYSPNDFDFSQSGSDHDITAFRPHKFEKAIDKARE